jgi:hypothetical protein
LIGLKGVKIEKNVFFTDIFKIRIRLDLTFCNFYKLRNLPGVGFSSRTRVDLIELILNYNR